MKHVIHVIHVIHVTRLVTRDSGERVTPVWQRSTSASESLIRMSASECSTSDPDPDIGSLLVSVIP